VRVVSAGRGSVYGMMSMICRPRSLHVGYTCLALVFHVYRNDAYRNDVYRNDVYRNDVYRKSCCLYVGWSISSGVSLQITRVVCAYR